MSLKPWREIVVPHKDVLAGTFQQSEFAADLSAVRDGRAPVEYQDAAAFFERTFITEGMRLLLTQVAQRLAGQGGEPVIQLQTAFGGGKTHTMLAVYHLATRTCGLSELAGVPQLVERAGLMDVPKAKAAVLDGTKHPPGQPWKRGRQVINTLWGELAWQLGGSEAFALVKQADETGTSPGKEALRDLLERNAPAVVLLDEMVAYVRQFVDGKALSGGTYESNISFIQALTEAAKLVPNAIVLGSLPESKLEAGGERGADALRGLEKTFGRVQALWKPVAIEEAFKIVRLRLFEKVRNESARDAVCRAFADAYRAEGTKVPSETQESHYEDRMVGAYPVHPEVFDRLYEDWTTLEGFQRTRGVLKLMAKVIHRLWQDGNADLMIMPGSMPLDDGNTRNELVAHLNQGWDAVLDKDVDGDKAETTELEGKEPRFGQVQAARRVARTLFLGSAPSSVVTRPGIRGLGRDRVLLGCLQPGQASSVYADALGRLVDKLHYLNASGDKSDDTTRFWFDTRANLRREMEDRKKRFEDKPLEVETRIIEAVKSLVGSVPFFDGVHLMTPHSDVPDDGALRLVVLATKTSYAKDELKIATEAVLEYVRSNGTKPRYRGNRLLFLAADRGQLPRLRDAAKVALAWASIVADVEANKLNIDRRQMDQAQEELKTAKGVVPKAARECFKWVLCPVQHSATDPKATVEAFPLTTSSAGTVASEIERVCLENELVIKAWSPVHLRGVLQDLYWKDGQQAAKAKQVWEDSQKYLYLARLRNFDVLANAVVAGAKAREFFGTAYGQVAAVEGEGVTYEGFALGRDGVQVDDTLLLIEPGAAAAYEARVTEEARKAKAERERLQAEQAGGVAVSPMDGAADKRTGQPGFGSEKSTGSGQTAQKVSVAAAKARNYHGMAEVPAAMAKMKLVQLVDEIIATLGLDAGAKIKVTVDIEAEFPSGVSDQIKRAVSENAVSLGLKVSEWE